MLENVFSVLIRRRWGMNIIIKLARLTREMLHRRVQLIVLDGTGIGWIHVLTQPAKGVGAVDDRSR
jgi:hypothetical protein